MEVRHQIHHLKQGLGSTLGFANPCNSLVTSGLNEIRFLGLGKNKKTPNGFFLILLKLNILRKEDGTFLRAFFPPLLEQQITGFTLRFILSYTENKTVSHIGLRKI